MPSIFILAPFSAWAWGAIPVWFCSLLLRKT